MFGEIRAFDPFAVCFDKRGDVFRNKTHDQLGLYYYSSVEKIDDHSSAWLWMKVWMCFLEGLY